MFTIAPEDIEKFQRVTSNIVVLLNNGAKLINLGVSVGDDFDVAEVCGYWIDDTMRIDIKLKGK